MHAPLAVFSALFDMDFRSFLALAIPITAILVGGVIVVAGMYFHNRRREMWHQTARTALERGQPLPVDDEFRESPRPLRRERDANCDLRRGFILVAVGASLYFFLGGNAARVGAIPGFIGIALILFSFMGGTRRSDRYSGPDDRTPRT